jgi:hypothetical protein
MEAKREPVVEKVFRVLLPLADAGSFDCVRLSPHFAQDDSGFGYDDSGIGY